MSPLEHIAELKKSDAHVPLIPDRETAALSHGPLVGTDSQYPLQALRRDALAGHE